MTKIFVDISTFLLPITSLYPLWVMERPSDILMPEGLVEPQGQALDDIDFIVRFRAFFYELDLIPNFSILEIRVVLFNPNNRAAPSVPAIFPLQCLMTCMICFLVTSSSV